VTTDFNSRVAITNPVVFDTIDLNTSSGDLLSEILSKDVLPDGYELYIYDEETKTGVTYSVTVNSGEGGGSWTITGDDKHSTYVTGYNGNEYSNDAYSENQGDYSNTTVWFAVKAIVGCVPDTIVVDFGLPVYIDVMANDLMIGTKGVLMGVCKNPTDLSLKPVNGSNQELHSGFKTSKTTVSYGNAQVKNGKVLFTPTSMQMKKQSTFYYGLHYTGNVGTKGYYYSTVTVIPATTIYYEDSFTTSSIKYNAFKTEDDTQLKDNTVVWEKKTNSKPAQSQDRPGEFSLPALDANNIYGYDPAYANMTSYSMSGYTRAKVTKDYYGTAEFSFTGTGFDIISVCYNNTGTVLVSVYNKADFEKAAGDTTADKLANENLVPVAVKMVDTYYGYTMKFYKVTYKYTDGAWEISAKTEITEDKMGKSQNPPKNPTEGKTYVIYESEWVADPANVAGALYQIPVIKMDLEKYGTYTAVITASYAPFFDHYEADEGYLFYLDAIRIYNPANNGKNNDVIKDAYVADGEGWPSYYELRNIIIGAKTFDSLDEDDEISGVVFIDNILDKNSATRVNAISDYTNFGPNNELYLAPKQGISFTLPEDSNIAAVHMAMKTIYNGKSADIKVFAAGKDMSKVEPLNISTATDLYYDISHLVGKTIVIYNESDEVKDIVSITNIKITHKSDPGEKPAPMMLFTVSRHSVDLALASLAVSEEDTGNTGDTPAPDTQQPEQTEPTQPTEPEQTQPTEPKPTEPKPTEPKPTEPVETEPEVTEPAETEPAETEPEVTENTEPAVPHDDEAGEIRYFTPKRLTVKVSDDSVKIGTKVVVTVTASSDVEYITVNGVKLTNYETTFGGNRVWKVKVSTDTVDMLSVTVQAFDSDNRISNPVIENVSVTERHTSFFDWLENLLISFLAKILGIQV
jgi:hypothetical protein